MTHRSSKLLLWSPRVLGILVCLFLSFFALDSFQDGNTLIEDLPDFAGHIAPILILSAIVAVSWRWEWVGGVAFTGLGVSYAYLSRDHLSWIPVIAGPLLVVGILFFWSWVHHKALRTTA